MNGYHRHVKERGSRHVKESGSMEMSEDDKGRDVRRVSNIAPEGFKRDKYTGGPFVQIQHGICNNTSSA
jgi:hypothetical protein